MLYCFITKSQKCVTRPQIELDKQDPVSIIEDSHCYDTIDDLNQEQQAHTTEALVTFVEGASNVISPTFAQLGEQAYDYIHPDHKAENDTAAIATSSNQAYGCPVKKVDEGQLQDSAEDDTAAITTSSNQAYGCPVKEVDESQLQDSAENNDAAAMATSSNQAYGCPVKKVDESRLQHSAEDEYEYTQIIIIQ